MENESNPKIQPDENLKFGGLIVYASDEDFQRIKEYILTQTTAKLIYQRKSSGYLKIEESPTMSFL
ncbi:MAG: hypothetical protein NWE93_11305 [Candidatus Bathyarchaeota archaeon]|nr:hypothetical protein [Candidatus Bathyarchaeota archaeon]